MQRLSRARLAAAALYATTGAMSASWAGRIPAVQERLDLGPGGLAVALLGIEAGALTGLPLGGLLVPAVGSRRCLRGAFLVFAPALLVAAVAPTLALLALGLAAWAAANSVIDVALAAQGVQLNLRYGRPVLSSLTGAQSVGMLTGAGVATLATAGRVSLTVHLLVVAAAAGVLAVLATAALVDEPRPRGPRRLLLRPSRGLLMLGALAFCAFLIDGAAINWIAVHLSDDRAASQTTASAGYLLFAAALVLGRLAGDRLTLRWGHRGLARVCFSAAAVSGLLIAVAPTLPLTLLGWTLLGLTSGPLAAIIIGAVPQAVEHAAPAAPAIATVTMIGYFGSFTGPPLIGVLAQATSLSLALLTLVAAATAAAALTQRALPRRATPASRTSSR